MSDLAFEKLLEEHNEDFLQSESYSQWMPPDAEYVVLISATPHGSTVDKDSNEPMNWWKLTGQIQEPNNTELDGKDFTVGYFTSKNYGFLKDAAATIKGSPVGSLREAHEVIVGALGTLMKVKVVTTYSKKWSQHFRGCTIQQVLSVSEAPAVDATDPECPCGDDTGGPVEEVISDPDGLPTETGSSAAVNPKTGV
jgi:hypothetical protein